MSAAAACRAERPTQRLTGCTRSSAGPRRCCYGAVGPHRQRIVGRWALAAGAPNLARARSIASASHRASSAEPQLPSQRDGPLWSSVLAQAWRVACTLAVNLLRAAVVAAACALASLLPRPASALAASIPARECAAVVITQHSLDSSAQGGGGDGGYAVRSSSGASASSSTAVATTCRHLRSYGMAAPQAGTQRVASAAAPRRTGTPALLADVAASPATAAAAPARDAAAAASALPYEPGGGGGAANAATSAAAAAAPAGTGATTGTSNGISSGTSGIGGSAFDAGVAGWDAEDVALAQRLGISASEAAVVRLYERNRASVVSISGMRAMQTFTTLDAAKLPSGQGSGFIFGDKGHVVTCYHLVKGSAEVKVTLIDSASYTAKVIGHDAGKDLAVLKLSIPKSKLRELQPVTLGSAAALRVGQTVYAIGCPWGLGHTLSKGVVCALGGELATGLFPIKGVIQSDAAADASSGGVMLDSRGRLVGMVVAPHGGCGGGGRCFAVPVDALRGLITQIVSYGRTIRPALGLTVAPPQVLERAGMEGVLVLEVPPGSPAHAAGLRPTHRDIFGDLVLGDVITNVDGKPVRAAADVVDVLDEHRVGDRVKLDVLRDGKAAGLTVTLGERGGGAGAAEE